jgi:L,D-transpeptidase-like protein
MSTRCSSFVSHCHLAGPLGLAVGTGALVLGLGAGTAAAQPRHAAPEQHVVAISQNPRVSYWAYPQSDAVARSRASIHGRSVGRLRFLTPDGLGQAQIYTVLREQRAESGVVWAKISLPQRPNGMTGWVEAEDLGPLNVVYGLLVVNRSRLRATLYDRQGHAIWSAPVGIGRPSLPTPPGHFYVLEKLQTTGNGEYGPFALATSAYAPSLSEWPGGGVVGIHGTDEPQLIPGRPSHGCVRVRNGAITRLWHLIRIGERIAIT